MNIFNSVAKGGQKFLNKTFFIITVLALIAFVASPAGVFAVDSEAIEPDIEITNVVIDEEEWDLEEDTFSCEENFIEETLSISGSGVGDTPPGMVEQYGVVVDWGDGDIETVSSSFTPSSGGPHVSFSFTFNAEHEYEESGEYEVVAYLVHGGNEGNDNQASDSFEVCVSEEEPENQTPTIALNGDETETITQGDSWSDQGATADDFEDGDITENLVVGGDKVDTDTPGTYVITYDVTDSNEADAEQVTRAVVVKEQGNGDAGSGCIDECLTGGSQPEEEEEEQPEPEVLGATTVPEEEETEETPEPEVLGATVEVCKLHFTEYLSRGDRREEVRKWQGFLNDHLGLSLAVDGVFGPATVRAVGQFQNMYAESILVPWGYTAPTFRIYKTTRMQANLILGCPEEATMLEDVGKFWVIKEGFFGWGEEAPIKEEE